MNNYQWIWQFIRPKKKRLIGAMVLLVLNAGLILINPLLTGVLIDQVINKHETKLLVPILLVMIVVTILRTAIRYVYQLMYEQTGQDAVFDLRQKLYEKLQELDFDFFNHTRVGDIMARMTGDTDAIRHCISWVQYQVLECVIWFVCAVSVMAVINWKLMLSLVAVTPLIFIFTSIMAKKARPKFLDIRESFSRLNSMVEENIGGNRVVKAFTREDFEIKKFNEHNADYKKQNMESAKISQTYLPWLDFFASVLTVITIVFGGALVIQGKMTLGQLVSFNGYLWMLNQPMRMSGWLINDVQRFQASCVKIRQMLGTKPQISLEDRALESRIRGDVTFDHVSFHFSDDSKHMVLEDINFSAKVGQTVGILGETGAGKTTLVNLIARFYDPTSGTVEIDEKNAKTYPIRKLRESISMVMQDVFLFSDTIADNLAFGNPDADRAFLQSMAQVADADAFIGTMPEGYDTIVGERGVGLSGGQKQRISLARALVKDPAILILDDTTSAVDMETETKIQNALNDLTHEKTTFVIAHRISSVRDADLILMMEHGRVVEQGTHEELVAKHGMYYDVYQKQLGLSGGEIDGTK